MSSIPYKHPMFILVFLVFMGTMANFASDNFLPSLPYIASDLHAPHTLTRLTISIYLLGLGFSALIYGPLSDYYGRRRLLFIGYSIFILASILAANAHSIGTLLLARLLQACGIGAGTGLFRAILRDVFVGKNLAKASATLSIALALAPALAPITGGYIQTHLGWRANFVLLVILGTLLLCILAIYLPETLPASNRQKKNMSQVMKDYYQLLREKQFIGFALCSALAFSNIMVYATITPFLFLHTLKLTPIAFGWLSPFYAVSYLTGSLLNIRLLNFYSVKTLLSVASKGMLLGAFIMLVIGLFGILSIDVILIPMMLIALSNGFVFSNTFSSAFEAYPKMAGMAGALFSTLQLFIAGICGSLASLIPIHNQVGLALMLTVMSLLLAGILRWVRK